MQLARSRPILTALVAVLLARTAVNGGFRVVYPFLPEIARGLGVGLGTVGLLLSVRAAVGMLAPAVPALIARAGHQRLMLTGLGAVLAGCVAMTAAGRLGGSLGLAAAGFVLLGAAKPLFDIPMQGWFGARVPPRRRGRVLGVTELAWAGGLVLAFPAGWLIAGADWTAMFWLVAVLAAGGLVAVGVLIPRRDRVDATGPARALGGLPRVPLRGPLGALLATVVLFRLAAELLFVVYGSWLESDLGLAVAAIGAFTLIVVASELTGEGAVAAFADRLGLRRTVLIGLVGTTVVYAGLGLVGGSLAAAIVAVVLWFALFEITIVATVPLAVALGRERRERLLALVATVSVGSSAVAALLAPALFAAGGIALTGLIAAGCTAVAGVVLATRVPDAGSA